jgi:hypothetical protein
MTLDNYNAIGIAEGFVENPGTDDEERYDILVAAWQHLIDTGLAWTLQGTFGRVAASLIEQGVCTPNGGNQ